MADATKYQLVPNANTNILTDLRGHFSLFRTRKSSAFVYGVVLVFVAFTVILAFAPSTSSSSSSPWFINVFAVNYTSPPTFSDQSYRSHFSSIFSYFFPNSSQIAPSNPSRSQLPPDKSDNFDGSCEKQSNQSVVTTSENSQASVNSTEIASCRDGKCSISENPSNQSSDFAHQISQASGNLSISGEKQSNQSTINPPQFSQASGNSTEIGNCSDERCISSQNPTNQSSEIAPQISEVSGNLSRSSEKESNRSTVNSPQIAQASGNLTLGSGNSTKKGDGKAGVSGFAASLSRKQGKNHGNGSVSGEIKKQGKEEESLVGSLVDCDLYDGEWVRDDSYPLYKPGSCKLIDEQFNCILNGRPDSDYDKLKWKPKGCSLPRLIGGHMLELLRGKRLVFVGDSLNRNMWESLVCILRNSVRNPKNVYEAFGRHSFRTEASYSFVFKDYNCTVEFFVSPFLVQQWETKDEKGEVKETLRLDLMVRDAHEFKNADFVVFNTGHWWTHDKTSKGEDYYQEGSHVYKQLDVTEAFRRAITTWARWVDANINPNKTHVLF